MTDGLSDRSVSVLMSLQSIRGLSLEGCRTPNIPAWRKHGSAPSPSCPDCHREDSKSISGEILHADETKIELRADCQALQLAEGETDAAHHKDGGCWGKTRWRRQRNITGVLSDGRDQRDHLGEIGNCPAIHTDALQGIPLFFKESPVSFHNSCDLRPGQWFTCQQHDKASQPNAPGAQTQVCWWPCPACPERTSCTSLEGLRSDSMWNVTSDKDHRGQSIVFIC